MPKPGYITPSKFKTMVTNGRNKTSPRYIIDKWPGDSAYTYADEIVLDLVGVHREEVTSASLEYGKEMEQYAIERYELETMNHVQPVTEPIIHPEFDYICGTPDGLIGSNRIIEVKCPWNPINHLQNILDIKQFEKDYKYQANGYLWITGRKYLDFVSFDLRFPNNMQIYIHTIERDEEIIAELEEKAPLFWKIVQSRYQELVTVSEQKPLF